MGNRKLGKIFCEVICRAGAFMTKNGSPTNRKEIGLVKAIINLRFDNNKKQNIYITVEI